MKEYNHKQLGTLMIISLGLSFIFLVGFSFLFNYNLIIIILAIVLLASLLMFYSLNVRIEEGSIDIWFGVGIIKRKILISEIKSVRVVKTPWWYGWGIRYIPAGWMWNVSGFDGVELEFKDSKKFRIGTDDPFGLEKALKEKIN
jgi:hypothetical protein